MLHAIARRQTTQTCRSLPRNLAGLLAGAALFVIATPAHAQWTGAAGTDDWFTAGNWGTYAPQTFPDDGATYATAQIYSGSVVINQTGARGSTMTIGGNQFSTTGETATLTVSGGGSLQVGQTDIGMNALSTGSMIVTGAGTTWDVRNPRNNSAGPVNVGYIGTGTLTVADGATVSGGSYMTMGYSAGANGALIVTGADSSITQSTYWIVGRAGTGSAEISDGASATLGTYAYIGNSAGSVGTVTVTGEDSLLTVGTLMRLGMSGTGTLTVADGGAVTVTGLTTLGYAATGVGTLNIGAAAGEAAAAAGTFTATGGITFGAGSGTIVFNHTDTDYVFANAISTGSTTISSAIQHLSGVTTLSADSSAFTGTTDVTGGTLYLTGILGGTTTVSGAGTLGGTGTIGTTTIGSGGTLAPGLADAIGTLNVNGNLTFASGSTYAVQIGTNGVSDSVAVTGDLAIETGARVSVLWDSAISYETGWAYTIASYGGTRTGQFDAIDNSILLSYALNYDDTAKTVGLTVSLLSDNSGGGDTGGGDTGGGDTGGGDTDGGDTGGGDTGGGDTGGSDGGTDTGGSDGGTDTGGGDTGGSDDGTSSGTLRSFGVTGNQIATAGALDALGTSNTLWLAVASVPDAPTARSAFDQLAGTAFSSAQSALVQDSQFVRNTINNRIRGALGNVGAPSMPVLSYGPAEPAGSPAFKAVKVQPGTAPDAQRLVVWGSGFGSWGSSDGDGSSGKLDRSTAGFLIGADVPVLHDWRLGLLAGYSRSTFDTDYSDGSSDSYHLGAYAGRTWGALAFRAGLAYSWNDIETSRQVAFGTVLGAFNNTLSANYDGGTFQAFGELGYRIDTAAVAFEPFANLAYVQLNTDGFTETGGIAALAVASGSSQTTFTTLGLRASSDFMLGSVAAVARGSLGWQHAFGDITPTSTNTFVAGGSSFVVSGVPITEDAAVIEAGLDLKAWQSAVFGLSYTGEFGSGSYDNGFNLNLKANF